VTRASTDETLARKRAWSGRRKEKEEEKVDSHRHLMLFVAGDEPNSRIARDNFDRLCAGHETDNWEIEIVDILDDTDRALANHILVTPTLLQLHPGPRVLVIGNLSDLDKVRSALGLVSHGDA
jgi:circadian clock protein KaiB